MIPNAGLLDLFIVNPNYERVVTIINSSVPTGSYFFDWDANDFPDGYYRAIADFVMTLHLVKTWCKLRF